MREMFEFAATNHHFIEWNWLVRERRRRIDLDRLEARRRFERRKETGRTV